MLSKENPFYLLSVHSTDGAAAIDAALSHQRKLLPLGAEGAASEAAHWLLRMEIATDEALIVQEVLEQGKAAVRFGTPLSISKEDVVRNGRKYRVDFHREETAVEGAAVIRLSCEVTHESGETYRAETLVDR